MPIFRKKPVAIEAVQWTGRPADFPDVMRLAQAGGGPGPVALMPTTGCLSISTLEGVMTASPGDWVIRGVKGEIYPCKPDIFAATYGAPQEAQTPDPVIENNFVYHSPKPGQNEKYVDLRAKAKELAYLIKGHCPPGREAALATTNLEQAIFWANAAIARS